MINSTKQSFFGNDAKFHHIGVAVKSINNSLEQITDPIQKVKIAFIELGEITLELLEPADDCSPITTSIQKKNKLVHICYSVPNIDAAIICCKNFGFKTISKKQKAVAFDKYIIWVYSATYGLIELIEES